MKYQFVSFCLLTIYIVGTVFGQQGDLFLKNYSISEVNESAFLLTFSQKVSIEEEKSAPELERQVQLEIRDTPLVLRTENGPQRLVLLRPCVDGSIKNVEGTFQVTEISSGKMVAETIIHRDTYRSNGYPFSFPEPTENGRYRFTYRSNRDNISETEQEIKPVRPWTFFINTHTHFDIGFTHSQKEVLENLTDDMKKAVEHCEATKDYPTESRYRWTIEGTGLLWHFINRHNSEEVAQQIKWIKEGRIELCGFNYNMACEMLGHEQLIRCLYWADQFRREYGVTIDTAQINDVPGWAWALPDLFSQAGIKQVSFRANPIRGNFLWYREGALPRAFYWEGSAGGKVLMWYTDTYRDANFFREPGLHEEKFVELIEKNEKAGVPFDYIQLRMGGDNLPPDINVSKNAKAWNEKYVWPKLIVSTNREFLEAIEAKYGGALETYRGDAPSWWADGPASAARETGQVRLLHDRLVTTEGLWTFLTLLDPTIIYPKYQIDAAMEKMMLFDEHTWGASESIRKPKSAETILQWETKASFAKDAMTIVEKLETLGRARAAQLIPASSSPNGVRVIAVLNPLVWTRTDIVTLPLADSPFVGLPGIKVIDLRDGKEVPVQMSIDDSTASFVAKEVPSFGYTQFAVMPIKQGVPQKNTGVPTLENAFYRITAKPEAGGLSSWFDKRLNHELLDQNATYLANQPVYERSLSERIELAKKTPQWERKTPQEGRLIGTWTGDVYDEMILETSLPSVPRIRQHVRMYKSLPFVDIKNVVLKNEVFDPEGVYFAFPFDVPKPEFRFQIADTTMRPGIDQLKYSCQDFYAIGQWASVSNNQYSILFAPLEAYLVTAPDLNAYQWTDKIEFDKGHLYSWIMNNYWVCNFRNGQDGEATFRYRLGAYAGKQTPVESTRLGWQPFYPLTPIWLDTDAKVAHTASSAMAPTSDSLLSVEGDPLVISCVKREQTGDAIIVRLLELNGKAGRSRLVFHLPNGYKVNGAFQANCLETPIKELPVFNERIEVSFKANEILTIGIRVAK